MIGLDRPLAEPLAEPLRELALRDPAFDITEPLLEPNLDLLDKAECLSSSLSSSSFYSNLGSNDSIDISGLIIGLSFLKTSVLECSSFGESELCLLIV